jgi:hypothetical protein
VLALGPDVTRRSRVRSLKYYGSRTLCDLTVHGDHLSVYIRGFKIKEHPAKPSNTIVSGRPQYIHAQLRSEADYEEVLLLLKKGLSVQVR